MMTIKEAIDQLKDLRLDHGARIEDDADGEVWEADVEALAMAIGWGGLLNEKDKHGWIHITDHLPAKDDRVLVYRPCMIKTDVGAISVQSGWACHSKRTDITHWMPLPESPEEEETEQ